MKLRLAVLCSCFLSCGVAVPVLGQDLKDLNQLVGKKVVLQRIQFCEPGTLHYTMDHAGETATVLSVTPKFIGSKTLVERGIPHMKDPEMRKTAQDSLKSAIVLVQLKDETKLDTCWPITPGTASSWVELAEGETLGQSPTSVKTAEMPVSTGTQQQTKQIDEHVALSPPIVTTSQDCPVIVTKVLSSGGGLGHALADAITTSQAQREIDETLNGSKHYLDMHIRNAGSKNIRAIEYQVVYLNVMGDETLSESMLSQNDKPIKPGQEHKSYFMDRSLQSENGRGDVTVYIKRVRFEDNSFWQDNGSHSCKLTSSIK